MVDMNEKLTLFSQIVKEDALSQMNALDKENDEKKAKAVNAFKEDYERERENRIKFENLKIQREYKQVVAKKLRGYRVELIKKRDEIVNDIFDKVVVRLNDYMKTDDYKNFIIDRLGKAEKIMDTKDFELCCNERDMALCEKIVDELKYQYNITLKLDRGILIGGVIIKKKDANLISDETFDFRLNQAKEGFIKESGLTIPEF